MGGGQFTHLPPLHALSVRSVRFTSRCEGRLVAPLTKNGHKTTQKNQGGSVDMNFNIDNIIQKVTDALSTKTVIGDPIEIGQISLIPVMNVSFGFGGGGGDGGSSASDHGSGAGGAGGARISVTGMMVVKGDEVSFIPTGKSAGRGGSIEKLVDALPDLLETLKGKTGKEENGSSAEPTIE